MYRDKKKDGTTLLTAGITLSEIMDAMHPIGDIYMSIDPTNPAAKFGGTWEAWAEDAFVVGVGADPAFNSVEETGGSMDHSHDLDTATSGARVRLANDNNLMGVVKSLTSRAQTRELGVSSNAATSSNSTLGVALEGESEVVSSLPPYMTCYIWKRTA